MLPLNEEKITKSKAFKKVCEKVNAVMATDLAKIEKVENEGENFSYTS